MRALSYREARASDTLTDSKDSLVDVDGEMAEAKVMIRARRVVQRFLLVCEIVVQMKPSKSEQHRTIPVLACP